MIYISKDEVYDIEGGVLKKIEGPLPRKDKILVVEFVTVRTYFVDKAHLKPSLERDFSGDKYLFSVETLAPNKFQVYSTKQGVIKTIKEHHEGEVFPYYLALKRYREENTPENYVLFLEQIGNKAILTYFSKDEIVKPRVIVYHNEEDFNTEITRSIVGLRSESEPITIYSNREVKLSHPAVKEIKIYKGSFALEGAKHTPADGRFLLPEEIELQQKKDKARGMRKKVFVSAAAFTLSFILFISLFSARMFYDNKKISLISEISELEKRLSDEFAVRYGSLIYVKDLPYINKCYSLMSMLPPGYKIYSLSLSDKSGEMVVGPDDPVYYFDLNSYITDKSVKVGLKDINISYMVSARPSFLIKF